MADRAPSNPLATLWWPDRSDRSRSGKRLSGAGAATFRKLAGAGVNADLLVPVRVSDDLFFAVICVDDPDKARRALAVQVISEDDFVL